MSDLVVENPCDRWSISQFHTQDYHLHYYNYSYRLHCRKLYPGRRKKEEFLQKMENFTTIEIEEEILNLQTKSIRKISSQIQKFQSDALKSLPRSYFINNPKNLL